MTRNRPASSGTVRRVALICGVYVVVTLALVLWSRRMVTDQAWDIMEGVADLVAHESALTMNDAINRFTAGEIDRAHLGDRIRELADRSAAVRYATVIGADGRLIATNNPDARDPVELSLQEAFDDDQRSRIETRAAVSLRRGEFLVQIPFSRAGEPVAYLRLNLTSESIASLYRSAYLSHLVISAAGMVAVGALGLLLHLEYERRRRRHGQWLAAVLSGTEGVDEVIDPSMVPALEAADSLQSALAEGEIRAAETRRQLGQLDRALDVGFVVTDGSGDPQIVGERARELLGVEDLDDAGHQEVEETLRPLAHTLNQVVETDEIREASLEVLRSDQTIRLDAKVAPLETEDGRAAILQLRDRKQVRALQKNLLDAARLRSLTRLYLGVAHDLRAPLNAVALNLANLKHSLTEVFEEPDRAQNLRTLELIEDELHRLQRSIEALLQQTEPDREKEEEFNLCELVEKIELLVRPQARQQRLDLTVRVPHTRATVLAHRDWVQQAILNLIVNAFDATPNGGRVDVEVRLAPEWTDVIVSDTGPGIPDSIAPSLFQMYASTKSSGSGIGLFAARAAIEACGGTLELVRTGSDGAAFQIRLPRTGGFASEHEA